jgi:hypothetical protein
MLAQHPHLLVQHLVYLVDRHAALLFKVHRYSRVDVAAARVHHQAASSQQAVDRYLVVRQLCAGLLTSCQDH